MKAWELEEGKLYTSDIPQQEKFIYSIIDGEFCRCEEGIWYKDYSDYNYLRKVNFSKH